MSAGPRLIVNVDDLGLHPAVRRAVEACAAQGTVTSASVLANGPDQDAVRPYPGLTLGAHLNILRGAPLSPPREVTSLVGENGLFLGSFSQLAFSGRVKSRSSASAGSHSRTSTVSSTPTVFLDFFPLPVKSRMSIASVGSDAATSALATRTSPPPRCAAHCCACSVPVRMRA